MNQTRTQSKNIHEKNDIKIRGPEARGALGTVGKHFFIEVSS